MKSKKPKMFLPYAATCGSCKDLMVTVRPRHFVTCKCGDSNLDAGDGIYWRCGGNIDKVWKLRRSSKYTSWKLMKFPTQ